MKCLILSCNTGEGHYDAAVTLKRVMELNGYQAELIDYLALSGKKPADLDGSRLSNLTKYLPHIFQFKYLMDMLITSRKYKSPVYMANTFMAGYLKEYLSANNYDLIIMTHLYPAETISYMKKHYNINIPTIFVTTDYLCNPFIEETDIDAYVIPSPALVPEFVRRSVESRRIYPYGIPTEPAEQAVNKLRARHILHLQEKGSVYLIMGEHMRYARLLMMMKEMRNQCSRNEQIVVICGEDNIVRRRLKKAFGLTGNIHIVGNTERIPWYMDACDVVFTVPDGYVSTMAANKNIPIVFTHAFDGYDSRNRGYFTSRGMAYSSSHISRQISMGRKLAVKNLYRTQMTASQREWTMPDAAQEICTLAERMAAIQ